MIQIAVLGYGTVGSGVVEVINRNQESINKKAGEEINIKYVLDLRDFPGDPVQEKIVHDYEVIANDPEIKIVVEVMGGTNPAYTFELPFLKIWFCVHRAARMAKWFHRATAGESFVSGASLRSAGMSIYRALLRMRMMQGNGRWSQPSG